MTFSLIWMPEVLLRAGLKVALTEGWTTRGRGDIGPIRGVLCHHTAGPLQGNLPSLRTLIEGRPDVAGPLAHLGLGRDGTFYAIAAGRANHAGRGSWQGVESGNASFIGIEAENTGRANDQPWPAAQMQAYRHGVAALLRHIGLPPEACAGHKEYALPPGRKIDPSLDMQDFRTSLAAILNGTAAPLEPIPSMEPAGGNGTPRRRTLRRGDRGDLVKALQAPLGLDPDGIFGGATEAAVRRLQRARGLVPDGIVGPKTWAVLAAARDTASGLVR